MNNYRQSNLSSSSDNSLAYRDLPKAELAFEILASKNKTGPTLVICKPSETKLLADELRFFAPESLKIVVFDDWETLPYDHFSPHQDLTSARLELLTALPLMTEGIILIATNTLLNPLMPAEYLQSHSLSIHKQQSLNLADLRKQFIRCGYQQVDQVFNHGEFAVRGSILDLFPMGSPLPYRIDFFDDEIDSLRFFNPETQRSEATLDKIELLPAREFPLNETSIELFRKNWREYFEGNPLNCPTYQMISQGRSAQGIEYYLPFFYNEVSSFFDYLPINSLIINMGNLAADLTEVWDEIQLRYEQHRYNLERPLIKPEQLFFNPDKIQARLSCFSQLNFNLNADQKLFVSAPYVELAELLKTTVKRILITAESLGNREKLIDKLLSLKIQPSTFENWAEFCASTAKLGLCLGNLRTSFTLNDKIIVTQADLTGEMPQKRHLTKNKQRDPKSVIQDLLELRPGEMVVHIEHGVGRYLGLNTVKDAEFITIEYANQNKLYVPVTNLHLISRYGGLDTEHVKPHSLGTEQWQKIRKAAIDKIIDVATELLEIHAQRAAKPGHAFTLDKTAFKKFAESFPFDLTSDQELAISQIIADMTSDRAMDRLVCGDVGFGKTEVAMRAAFIATQNSKQVAVLVPTTLLAKQHEETFNTRFADTGTQIVAISRFKDKAQQTAALADLAKGKIDIIIGTHILLQDDIKFSNLGLLIIDEEHRFGVRQKERIKALRAEIDILTLTATPIPRTLNMALSDVRDLSIIGTPPAKRLAVKTFVHEQDSAIIREAIMREIMRGGQVFYLHNSVDTIAARTEALRQLVPEAKMVYAHGQMPKNELEKVMSDFYHQQSNVLVSTTIIENGLDIPTANTIIIERADKLGLAQLHQLRGRVGRSHHQAYAYLLIPNKNLLSSDAEKRLDAISQLEDLGIGFSLATHDLEIRGCGEILGEEQSGHLDNIGFSLYMELLERAVESLKSGKIVDLNAALLSRTEIDLRISALIPETYVPDIHTRLILYKRISNAKETELDDLQIEFIDRFGLLPEPTKNLFALTSLRLIAANLGIEKLQQNGDFLYLNFKNHPDIDPLVIIQLLQAQPKRYKMDNAQRLRISIDNKMPIINQVKTELDFLKLSAKMGSKQPGRR